MSTAAWNSKVSFISEKLDRVGQTFTAPQRQNVLIKTLILAVVSWIWATLYFQPQILQALFDFSSFSYDSYGYGTSQFTGSYFHFLIPSSQPSTALCRTVLSAAALNYPTPRIINWHADFNNTELPDRGFQVAKITGVLEFLNRLDASHDDELVLVVDHAETWFQLRPEVLIQRYHEINTRANKRLQHRYSRNFHQSIVFAAQKQCEGREKDHTCVAVPPSDLPSDVYGSKTDTLIDGAANPYATFRPRHLNSASIMGPAGLLKALYKKAAAKLETGQYANDQAVFADIFAEQETHRERARKSKNGILQTLASAVSKGSRTARPSSSNSSSSSSSNSKASQSRDCEFTIGLDYHGEILSPSSLSDAGELASVTFQDKEPAREAAIKAGSRRRASLPDDVRHSTPPFWTPDYSGETILPDQSWAETPLYANVWSTTVPAAIQYNMNSSTSTSTIHWQDMWFFRDLRKLSIAHAKSFRMPFAVLKRPQQGDMHEYWSSVEGYGGVRVNGPQDVNKWKLWDDICPAESWKDVLGDGDGDDSDSSKSKLSSKASPVKFRSPIWYLPIDLGQHAWYVNEWRKRYKEGTNGI